MDKIVIEILILLILIVINAFFAMSEIALITINDNKIKKMANAGDKRAKKIVKIVSNSSDFLATIQVGVTLSGFLTSASASQSFSGFISNWLSFLPLSESIINFISTFVITLILSYFSLVLGELVPKKIAMKYSESISLKVSGTIVGVGLVFRPFVRLLSASTNLVLKILGLNPADSEETVTEEEILMMVDAGNEKGVIESAEKEMIANIFEFDDTTVSEVMTHRIDMTTVEDNQSIDDVIKISTKMGYSRIPVYKEDLDTIVGIIYVKDLLPYINSEKRPGISEIMRPVMFVPESQKCNNLFSEMRAKKVQIAIVVDEYGGTSGLVTMEDLIEEILGNIQDEYDNEDEEIQKVSDNTFTVDGSTDIDEISDLLGISLPQGNYDTIAGLIVENLERIPKPGESPSVIIGNIKFTVQAVDEHRITKVLVEKAGTDG